jgi:hypothetical protein
VPRHDPTQHVAQHHTTPLRNGRNNASPPKGGGCEAVASVRARRKEENRLLLKEWFAQKREIPDVAGMSHVSTVLRRIIERESA